jgi:prolyl-tRNA synthetase
VSLTSLGDTYKRLPLKAFQAVWSIRAPLKGDPLPLQDRLLLEGWALCAPAAVEQLEQELAGLLVDGLARMGMIANVPRLSPSDGSPFEVCTRLSGGHEGMLGCSQCGYLARACTIPIQPGSPSDEPLLPRERVSTPGADTIRSLCHLLGIPPERTAKAMMFSGRPVGETQDCTMLVLVRGDRDVSWQKLAWATGWTHLRRASPDEIAALGAVPGYASPIGIQHTWILVDREVAGGRNLVTGANADGYHLINTTYGRDYTAWKVADVVVASPEDACPTCGASLQPEHGLLLGVGSPILPDRGDRLGSYMDQSGAPKPLAGIGLALDITTVVGSLAAGFGDDRGLGWPPLAAPFLAHLIGLPSCEEQAEELCARLLAQGVEVVLDDRQASPGVKLKDADLIGLPVRIVISKKSLTAGGAEVTERASGETQIVPIQDVGSRILQLSA